METDVLDYLLRDFNITVNNDSTQNQQQETVEESSPSESFFSEEDILDIISENETSEEEEEVQPSEETSQQETVAEEAETDDSTEEPQQSEEPDTIPCNSPTLLINETTTRFSGAEWFNEIQKARVIVAGIGGIGSNFCFQLARMIPASIVLYDSDIVNAVNMAGQLFCTEDIGKNKVDAMSSMISKYTTMRNVMAISSMFDQTTEPGDIMICGFDNMRARAVFFNSWIGHLKGKTEEEKRKCLYMDGRLSMTDLQILCIRGDDTYNINRYQKEFLFSDLQADATVCSMKQTTYLACMIGSLMVNLFTNFIANSLNPVIPYDMPFFTEYDAQNIIFKTEN